MRSLVATMRTAKSGELPGSPGWGMLTCAEAATAVPNKVPKTSAVWKAFMDTPFRGNKSQPPNASQLRHAACRFRAAGSRNADLPAAALEYVRRVRREPERRQEVRHAVVRHPFPVLLLVL